jgi:hypothetical protein
MTFGKRKMLMLTFLQDLFYREPSWSDPKAQRWATLFQSRARLTGQLPDKKFMDDSGLGPDHRFWKQDNKRPSEGFAVNFDIPFYPFLDGTEDEALKGVEGLDDFGRKVRTFPIKTTGKKLHYDFMDRILDLPIKTESVTTKLMVEVCCGLLALRILPRRGDFTIGSDLDFRVARLRRITWDASMGAWYPIFIFDTTENPEPQR